MIQLPKWLRTVFTRVVVFYIFVYLIIYVSVDLPKLMKETNVVTLNRYRPNFKLLVQFTEQGTPIDRKTWNGYIKYYNVVKRTITESPGVYGLLGFCYYQTGNYEKAIKNYKKAIEINPYFFWFQYNLAITYYQQGELLKAEEALLIAIKTVPKNNIMFYGISKPYRAVLQQSELSGDPRLMLRLKKGYSNAVKLLATISFQKKDFQSFSKYIYKGAEDDKQDGEFILMAGMASYLRKDYKDALNFLLRYQKVKPEDRFALELIGNTMTNLNKRDIAQKFYERANKIEESFDFVARAKKMQPQIY